MVIFLAMLTESPHGRKIYQQKRQLNISIFLIKKLTSNLLRSKKSLCNALFQLTCVKSKTSPNGFDFRNSEPFAAYMYIGNQTGYETGSNYASYKYLPLYSNVQKF